MGDLNDGNKSVALGAKAIKTDVLRSGFITFEIEVWAL
jgi:hypothetical protein